MRFKIEINNHGVWLDSIPAIVLHRVCDCGSKSFFIMNFLNFLRKTTVSDSNDSNKTGMGFALSRDLFYFGFFVAAAEFRLGFGRC